MIEVKRDGRIWSLELFDSTKSDAPESAAFYLDPARAIADLAAYARQNWAFVAGWNGAPSTAPEGDLHAIGVFFVAGAPMGGRSFSLGHWPRDEQITGEIIEHDGPPVNWTHVVCDAWGEWLCPCGNIASYAGFYPCTLDGTECVPDNDWPETYACVDCDRIILLPFGQILPQRVTYTATVNGGEYLGLGASVTVGETVANISYSVPRPAGWVDKSCCRIKDALASIGYTYAPGWVEKTQRQPSEKTFPVVRTFTEHVRAEAATIDELAEYACNCVGPFTPAQAS